MTERAAGQIHDLGYKRYAGTRRPPSTRWRGIARHQIAAGWKGWWRYKLPLAIAVVITIVCAVLIFVMSSRTIEGVTRGHSISFADLAMPEAISWCCRAAFIFTLTVSAGVIAGDIQSGAFTFYFARSTRPIDYLAGKVAGLGVLVAGLVLVFPVLVGCLRLGIADSTDTLLDNLTLVPKMMLVGLIATLVYTTVPLGFSALVGNKRYALGLWAAYYMIAGTVAAGIGMATHSSIGAIDLTTSILAIANHLIHVDLGGPEHVSMVAALVSIGVHVGLSLAIVWFQLTSAQKSGVGGAT